MTKKQVKIIYLLFVLMFVSLIASAVTESKQVAQNGFIDISTALQNNSNKILLNGDWIFFPDTLIPVNQITNSLNKIHNVIISVPSKRKETKNHNFGTYYLQIKSNKESIELILNTLTIYSSATVFLNNKIIGEIGKPASSIEKVVPGLILKTKPFHLNDSINHLVIHYANFHREKNGIANNILLTLPKTKLKRSVVKIIRFAIILGTLLFIIFSQINYYFIRRKNTISIIFAFAAIMIFFYIIFMSLYHFGDILPNYTPKFKLTLITWRLVYYSTVCFFAIYAKQLFPSIFYKPILYITIGYCSFSGILTLFFPLHISSINFNFFMYFTLFIGSYIAANGVIGLFKKIEFARLFTFGFVFFLLTVINDILHNLLIINSINLLDLGIFGMMLTQAQIINLELNRTIFKNEKLSVHLQYINNNLEEIVQRRTEEIEEQKSEIEAQRDEITTQRDYVESQNKLILHQTKTITDSINYAKEIQQAVLPEERSLQQFFNDSFILFKPKDNVSGDFYWIRHLNFNNQPYVLFCVADCTGHGVPGALLSMLGMTLLNEITNHDNIKNTTDILELLRQRFKETLSKKSNDSLLSDGMHITLCMVNKETNMVHYSGAFQSLYHIHNQQITRYKGTRSIIGSYIHEKAFDEITFQLEKNDRLYLFTDGFADQISGNGDGRFMQKKLLDLFLSYESIPFEKQKENLIQEFELWKGDFEQIDDVLIMGLLT